MTFEPHPREFFAPDQAPTRLTSLREKLECLAAQQMERSYVCRFDYRFAQITPEDFIERILVRGLGVRRLLVGDDFRFGARRAGDFTLLKAHAPRLGYVVEAMESVTLDGERVSSTAVRQALAAGDLTRAARLLGRPYSISGRVVRGDGSGPQARLSDSERAHEAQPSARYRHFRRGSERRGGRPLRGVASLGVRPTVKLKGEPVLEAHLLDFSKDVYGWHVRVDFLHKFRDEEKYADLTALTRQIARDVENAREYFRRHDAGSKQDASGGLRAKR